MRVQKKIFLWCAGFLGIVLALLVAVFFLAPAFLNSPPMKAKLQAAVSREIGGKVKFQILELSLLPLPHVVIRKPSFSIPERVAGDMKSISVYPQLFPLLKGKILLSKVQLQEPDFTITLRDETGKKTPGLVSPADMRATIKTWRASLKTIGPGLVLQIDKGRLVLARRGRPVLSLRNVNARFVAPPGEMDIAVKAESDPWGAVSLSGKISIDADTAEVQNLSGALGHSSLSDLSARLALTETFRLEVLSGKATLSLDELYPWLSSFESASVYLKDVQSLKGIVNLSSMNFGGPLSEPAAWQLKITGETKNALMDSKLLPAPLSVTGSFALGRDHIAVQRLSASIGKSSVSQVSARLDWKKKPRIEVLAGKAAIVLDEVYQWRSWFKGLDDTLKNVKELKGIVRLSSMNITGLFSQDEAWQITAAGSVENIALDTSLLPGPVAVSHGQFSLAPAKFAFADVHAAVLDSSLTLSGSLQGFPGSIDSVSLSANGNVGQQSLQWAFTTFSLPPELTVNAPLSLSPVHVVWQKPAGISLSGTLTASDGPAISMDFSRKPEELVIHHATIKDQDSSAIVSFRHQQQATDFSFSGTLAQATLNRIFLHRTFGHGKIQGDLHASVLTDQPLESTLRGKLEGDDIVIPWGVTIPVRIDSFSLHADGNILTIESATVAWGASHFNLKGDVTASTDGFVLDMDLSSDGVEVDEIQRALGAGRKSENQKARPSRKPIIRGMVQFKSSSVTYGRYTFSPVKAIATLGPDGVSAAITEAKVCGIAIPGTLTVSHGDIQMGFKPAVSKQDLDPAMTCLSGADVNMTGTFNLNADISAQGKSGALLSSLEGKVNFRSKNGKIYRYPVLTKIFSLLSVTEIFRGRLPQLGGSGFPYHSMAVQGDLHQGKFTIEKAYIGGSSLDIIAQGDVDIAGKKMDLVVLVAPFSTINWIIRHIPLVGKMMGGTLISIPVKVSGDLADPDVTFLAPSAVGSRILELMKNIVELPVQIISPILPKEKEK